MEISVAKALLQELRDDPALAERLALHLLPHLEEAAAPQPGPLMSIKAASQLLGMSEGSLRKHVQRRNVPSFRMGARRIVDIGTLKADAAWESRSNA